MQKVPELVVNERMSQGKRVKSPREKKKVSGRSIEEMNEEPNIDVEEMLEELGGENGRGSSGQVQGRRRQKKRPLKVVVTPWNGGECAKTRNIK